MRSPLRLHVSGLVSRMCQGNNKKMKANVIVDTIQAVHGFMLKKKKTLCVAVFG